MATTYNSGAGGSSVTPSRMTDPTECSETISRYRGMLLARPIRRKTGAKEPTMPPIIWMLGVPLSVVIVLTLIGVIRFQ